MWRVAASVVKDGFVSLHGVWRFFSSFLLLQPGVERWGFVLSLGTVVFVFSGPGFAFLRKPTFRDIISYRRVLQGCEFFLLSYMACATSFCFVCRYLCVSCFHFRHSSSKHAFQCAPIMWTLPPFFLNDSWRILGFT